jgi:geranylgeranyl diphosphate synthase, type II
MKMKSPKVSMEAARSCIQPWIDEALYAEFKDDPQLLEVVMYACRGGKHIRAEVCMRLIVSYTAEWHRYKRCAVAVELIHSASLIIDDLPAYDNASMRRGREAAHVRFDTTRALTAALALLGLSQKLVVQQYQETPIDTSKYVRLAELVSDHFTRLVRGQWKDILVQQHQAEITTVAEAEELFRMKTGVLFQLATGLAYTFACPTMQFSWDQFQQYIQAASHFGVVFQYIDDLHDEVSDARDGIFNAVHTFGEDTVQRRLRDLIGRLEATRCVFLDALRDTNATRASSDGAVRAGGGKTSGGTARGG